jgi:hypothetical protein
VLLQAVDSVHHALELWAVDQVERTFLAGKHFHRCLARSGDHSGSFFGREATRSYGLKRKPDQYAQTANAAALFVDLFLARSALRVCIRSSHCLLGLKTVWTRAFDHAIVPANSVFLKNGWIFTARARAYEFDRFKTTRAIRVWRQAARRTC